MKIYTFQPNFIWKNIQQQGFHHPFDLFEKDQFLKEDLERDWGFPHSYTWLKEKMLEKNIQFNQYNQHLIWGWYKWLGNKAQPDKRYASVYSFHKTPFVMLELDIDPNRVLLHDYDAWHFVLNYWYLGNEQQSDDFSNIFDYYKQKPLADIQADQQLKKSWEIIFDLEKSRNILEYEQHRQCVQATFFEIYLEDVKKIHYFENNRCIKIETIRN